MAERGDAMCRDIFRVQARALGLFFDEMINTFDPDALIVGGGAIETGELFQRWFVDEIRAGMPAQREEQADIPIHIMPNGDTAGARGAAIEALSVRSQGRAAVTSDSSAATHRVFDSISNARCRLSVKSANIASTQPTCRNTGSCRTTDCPKLIRAPDSRTTLSPLQILADGVAVSPFQRRPCRATPGCRRR